MCSSAASKPASSKKHRNIIVYVYADGLISCEQTSMHGAVIDKFDSIKEYHRYTELKLLEKAGIIQSLQKQVPLLLQEGYRSADGKWHRPTYYNADFMYSKDKKTFVEDVKALDKKTGKYLTTSTFRLKWKLLQAKYPDYSLILV